MPGQVCDPCGETVGHRGPFGLEQIERLPASSALEHTSVDPATKVASRPNANPPIQKNGELQNSLSSAVKSADRVEVPLVAEQRGVGVHHALGAPVEPDV